VHPRELANDGQLWVVSDGAGQLRLVQGGDALKELIAKNELTKTARVYVLSATSKVLGEIPELEAAFAPTETEAAPAAAPSNHAADDDFSLLDRPIDDGDYFEESARGRWMRPAGLAALLILLGAGGYQVVHARAAPAPVVAATAPVAAPPAPAAVAAPAALEPMVVVAAAPAPQPPRSMATPSPSYTGLVAAGQRQFESGHSRNAQALFERALAETPDGTSALVGLAYVHLDRGRVQQAIALFQRALGQDRGNPQALFGLAECHRQEGNQRAALDEFNAFLALQPTGSDADIARRLVQELTNGG
jgi:tetratricopeptide (TPR) repeat protein